VGGSQWDVEGILTLIFFMLDLTFVMPVNTFLEVAWKDMMGWWRIK
jgi:hypothetical protein